LLLIDGDPTRDVRILQTHAMIMRSRLHKAPEASRRSRLRDNHDAVELRCRNRRLPGPGAGANWSGAGYTT
jgi:hypothetical protein